LHSDQQNAIRKKILRLARGYGAGQLLFQGFPADTVWRRISLEQTDLARLRYANWPNWVTFSGGTRLVPDGAANINSINLGNGTNAYILAIAASIEQGKRYPELIGADGEMKT
jgi:hypothetical protein